MSPGLVTRPSAPFPAGRVLGDRFEIVDVLGEGGTGVVYEARRVVENDRVALKVIHAHLAGDRQIRGRFTREAAILRRLEGRHLCPLLDFGELEDPRREGQGLLYMVLPKIDGEALDRRLARDPLPPIDQAVAIMLGVCEALQEAHAQGIIHRDLKPANVLLRPGDDVVVVDFGMAKIMTGGGTGTTNLTQHNMVFGTPEYMAPEQARGDELDARCDVYAAGVMLYEMLAGRVPFAGASPLNVLTAQLTATPRPPREAVPSRGISAALEAVVLHALAKDPAERYATAAAFARALRRAAETPEEIESAAPSRRPAEVRVGAIETDAHAATIPAPAPDSSRIAPTVRPAARRSEKPVSSAPTTLPSAQASSSRGWAIVWVLAAILGIGFGVWLSLR